LSYLAWLGLISLGFFLAERLLPARPEQRALRPQLLNDLLLLAFNGHLWAVLTGALTGWLVLRAQGLLERLGARPEHGFLDGWPFLAQFALYLVASDFLQWCVHNLLHRVPMLWSFHKLHHSARALDWAVNFRFHWMELVVYRTLLYLPLLFLGGDGEPLFAVAIFATAWGHFNHSNLALSIGPLAYVFNSPRMHLWHHDASDEGGKAKNFGIVLSAWDWLFGTAYWPRERGPQRLGYPGDAEMPRDVVRQELFPLTRRGSQPLARDGLGR
jgi:sterol desaturase/sphingolipid hydroxylase (fatty acid hydroxylase superfamily)